MYRKKVYVCGKKGEKVMFFGEPSIIVGIIVMVITIRYWRRRRKMEKPVDKERLKRMDEEVEKTKKMVADTIEDLKRKGIWREGD